MKLSWCRWPGRQALQVPDTIFLGFPSAPGLYWSDGHLIPNLGHHLWVERGPSPAPISPPSHLGS